MFFNANERSEVHTPINTKNKYTEYMNNEVSTNVSQISYISQNPNKSASSVRKRVIQKSQQDWTPNNKQQSNSKIPKRTVQAPSLAHLFDPLIEQKKQEFVFLIHNIEKEYRYWMNLLSEQESIECLISSL